MTKSAAVSARDSASTDAPSSAEDHGAGNRHQQQHARQLEREQIVLEERRRDRAHRIQLLQLLLVEITRHNQLLREFRAKNDHDLAEEAEPNETSRQLPAEASGVRQLRRVPEVQ